MDTIPLRAILGPALQASKWQKCPMLLEVKEMEDLLRTLAPLWIIQTNGLIAAGQEIISQEDFLLTYSQYIHALKTGKVILDAHIRALFSSVWIRSLESVYAVSVRDNQRMVRLVHPAIQLQIHRFDYFAADNSFRSMILSPDSIHWGIQFSYPAIFQDTELQIHARRRSISEYPPIQRFTEMDAFTYAKYYFPGGRKRNQCSYSIRKAVYFLDSQTSTTFTEKFADYSLILAANNKDGIASIQRIS
jgi:hypothetical protein